MSAAPQLLPYIRRLLDPSALELGSDAELLHRFIAEREQAAFTALVARHGPMVLRLCQRVLGDAHAAEDAFQATFLVLSRKAAGIRHAETLAAWLHGVAYRLSLKMRAADARRRRLETNRPPLTSAPADPLAELSARELLTILDAELQRLPERYRLPVILCDLQGRTQAEAARILGWTPGSVKGRLERGRGRLHQRLLRRGLTLPAALLAMTATTARTPTLGATVSARVAELVEGATTGAAALKMKIAALVLAMSALTAGVGFWTHPRAEPRPLGSGPEQSLAHARGSEPRSDRYGDPLPPGALARLGTVRFRPGNGVWLVCRRGDDTVLTVAKGDDKLTVCVWRISTGQPLQRFDVDERYLNDVALSADGRTLATAGYDPQLQMSRIRFWHIPSGKSAGGLTGAGKRVYTLAFAPDGKTIATPGNDRTLRLWDCKSGTEIRRCEGAKNVWEALAFSPDGKHLASSGGGGIHLWDTASGRLVYSWKGRAAERGLEFSPDGKLLAAAGVEKTIRLWNVADGKEVRQWQSESGTSAIAFSPDGKFLASADIPKRGPNGRILETPRPIRLWDVGTGREVRRFAGHALGAGSLTFSADGKRLISGGWGNVLHIWDVASGKDLLPAAELQRSARSLAFSPDGRLLAAGGLDAVVRLWDWSAQKSVRSMQSGPAEWSVQVGFASDGRTLISHGDDGSLRSWDAANGREIRRRKAPAEGGLNGYAYSADGRTLALWRKDGTIRLVDAATGKEQRRLTDVAGDGPFLRFSPDGRRLLAMSAAGEVAVVRVLDTVSGKEERKWTLPSPIGHFAFSPDGRFLAVVADAYLPPGSAERTFHVWDAAASEDRSFKTMQHARVISVAFSPDHRMLAWGDVEGTITLWDRSASQIRRKIRGHNASILSLAFSADGQRLASGGGDTTILVWDATGRRAASNTGKLSADELRSLWDDLANKDAAKAFDAIGMLTASPQQAVPMLQEKLRPAPAPADREQMAKLIADLDSDEFSVRNKAMAQLRQLGERAEPGLRQALKDKLTLEARKRIDALLVGIRALSESPARLRELRAVEVLEHIGSSEARQVLQMLSKGASHARLTREAKAAMQRLAKRHPAKP